MISDVITLSGGRDEAAAVLAQAEKTAVFRRLSEKDAMHLRLMAEEMLSLMSAVAGIGNGKFRIEGEGDMLRMHLEVCGEMDLLQRRALLSVASNGRNEAHRGLVGLLYRLFVSDETGPHFFSVSPGSAYSEMSWSMRAYTGELRRQMEAGQRQAAENWAALEKSLLSHLADDVKVFIHESSAELVIEMKITA